MDISKLTQACKKNCTTPSSSKIIAACVIILSLLVACASLCFSLQVYLNGTPTLINDNNDGNTAKFATGSIADIAHKVSPGVVSILTETRTTSWFGQESNNTSAGTGMIVSSDGYILTNQHVVNGANNLNVILDNGTTYTDVSVVATDPLNDVAFLKINDKKAQALPTVNLGNSKTISVGQQVIAIGNALGQYSNSVTSGIISGTGRAVTATNEAATSSESLTDMIQTDAAINAGNSGGPLVNAAGQVIGINTAVSSNANDIGFAIPISSVKGMLNSILKTGSAKRAYLGLYLVNITPDLANEYHLSVSAGAYIYQKDGNGIIPDSPAAKAGLKNKDIIIAVNGTAVGAAGSVSSLIGEYQPGDKVQLKILRDGQELKIDVKLEAYKSAHFNQRIRK